MGYRLYGMPCVLVFWGGGKKSNSIKGFIPPKGVFHRSSSSTEGGLPPKGVFHQRLSSTKGLLPPKVIFHWRLSSTEGVFHQRSSSTKGPLPPKVVFHYRSSSYLRLSVSVLEFSILMPGESPYVRNVNKTALKSVQQSAQPLRTRFWHYDEICPAGSRRENETIR